MRIRRPSGMGLLTIVAVVVMAYLLLIPLLTQLISSLRGPGLPFGLPSAQWTLQNYQTLFSFGSGLGDTFLQTALFVGGAAIISTSLAFGLAWLVIRTDLPWRILVSALVLVPYIIPPIVRAQSYVLMLAPKTGILNQILRIFPWWAGDTGPIDPFSFIWVVIIQGFAAVTFPFLLLLPILQNMDGSLEEASRTSGAGMWKTVRRVTLPIVLPATLGIVILQVILLLGTLEVPLIFGQQNANRIFSLQLLNLLKPKSGQLVQYGLAATYGMIFLVITTLIFQGYRRVTRNANRRASIGGKGFRPTRMPLGRWKWPVVALVILYLIPTAILPGIALLWAAVTPYALPLTWDNLTTMVSLDAFGAVLVDQKFWASLGRTIVISGLSATLAVAVATIAAWTVARRRATSGTRLLDTFASSSVAIPAVIAGFACSLFYLVINKQVPLLGTIWVLVLAYAYRIAVSYRVSFSGILQISPELEESGAASGASRFLVFRRILLPLLLPTTIAVWIQLFILGAHEFTIPAMGLATPSNMPLSYYLYAKIDPRAAQDYAPNEGAAMALLFTVFVFALGYGMRWYANRRSVSRVAGGRRTDLASQEAATVAAGPSAGPRAAAG
ncbi:MAG: ABC transporter permease subunit [Chloroflexota bacterium]